MKSLLPIIQFALCCLLLSACPQPAADDDDASLPPSEHLFSFAVAADPHVTTGEDNRDRLERVLDEVDAVAQDRKVELGLIVGDVAWSGGLPLAAGLLGEAAVPWLPLTGDNEIQAGEESLFGDAWADQYARMAEASDDWVLAPTPCWNPDRETDSWFRNAAFSWRGVRFVVLDWASREIGTLYGEMADLHDFDGGTYPWFEQVMGDLPGGVAEDVLLFSHHPMHASPGAFTLDEMAGIAGVTSPLADRIAVAFSGHYHGQGEEPSLDGGFLVFTLDATWDDDLTWYLVEVWGDGARFEYRREAIVLDD